MDRGDNRDDWFADSEQAGPGAAHHGDDDPSKEDWLADVPPPPRPRLEHIDKRIVVGGAVAVAFLIAVLAAAGVFSSGSSKPVTTPTTPAITVQTNTTPTTSTVAASAPLALPSASLKPGDTGTQVKLLQQALVHLGLLAAKVDGQYGPATQAAVAKFQSSAALTADGLAGPATLAALATALNGA